MNHFFSLINALYTTIKSVLFVCTVQKWHFALLQQHLTFQQSAIIPPTSRNVAERRWSADQTLTPEADGVVILECPVRSKLEVVTWVLGFGREAECLAPGRIRERTRAEGEEMLAWYA